MPRPTLLIANRGEIAVRIARTARRLGMRVAALAIPGDDGHGRFVDELILLDGNGPSAFLDVDAVIDAADRVGAMAVHPGYGFLAESAEAASAITDAGLVWVGPDAAMLRLLGDKVAARALAVVAGAPVVEGTDASIDLDGAMAFAEEVGYPVIVKAVAGGGGRGQRVVESAGELAGAIDRCRSEAASGFGDDRVFVERLVSRARHLEVQILGDGTDVAHLGERECSLQRRRQKVVETAPALELDPVVRRRLVEAATSIGRAAGLRGVATVEFLLDADRPSEPEALVFCEVNPRLQVEHTVTEEIHGVDLVECQLALADGAALADLDLPDPDAPVGRSVQARITTERLGLDGVLLPDPRPPMSAVWPSGPGVRVDAAPISDAAGGFDPLVGKVIVTTRDPAWEPARRRLVAALRETEIAPVSIAPLLIDVLAEPDVAGGNWSTRLLDEVLIDLAPDEEPVDVVGWAPHPDGADLVASMQGTVVATDAEAGSVHPAGATLAVLEAMKMEHELRADRAVRVVRWEVAPGDTVVPGDLLARLETADEATGGEVAEVIELDPAHIRPDLADVVERHELGQDAARPDAVAKRHRLGRRTARENLADLVDPDTFVEYGPLVIAAQRARRPFEELITKTPADGLVGGIGSINGVTLPDGSGFEARVRTDCIVVSYDYTVLAGTQGHNNHRKKDRLFELAEQLRLPVVLFAEGGGGRPGDTDSSILAGLDCLAFRYFADLSGLVPLIAIVSGRCFAGNAALAGCADVVIATEDANLGMGGPAMIEGGGLGVFTPDEVGPREVHLRNGVVDLAVSDDAAAVDAAKRYLSYFQGPVTDYEVPDQRRLRHLIPENRLRIYDVRAVIDGLADVDSVLELRSTWGLGMVTSLARIEGRPVGIIANDPAHLAGAIDPDGADKAARFMQLCDAHDLPLLFLCDTPGFMVGPDVEADGLVRHAGRLFNTAASLDTPVMTIVLRKGYGLGAQAMAGGSFKAPLFTVSWPTGEFGGMGLEGFVRLGYRNELEAIEDPAERAAEFQKMVDRLYERGKAVSYATYFELDDVIDPADSRRWITTALRAAPPPPPRTGKKRPMVDTW